MVLGCTNDSERADAVDALAADLSERSEFENIEISEEDARCAAEEIVDDLGAARVEELDFVESEDTADLGALSEPETETVAGALSECVDDIEAVLVELMRGGMIEQAQTGAPISDTEAACTAEAIVEGFGAERLLVTSMSSGGDPFEDGTLTSEEAEIVAAGFVDCVDLRAVLEDQFGAEGLPPDVASCLAAEIPDQNLRELFAGQFSGELVDPDSLLGPAVTTCGLE